MDAQFNTISSLLSDSNGLSSKNHVTDLAKEEGPSFGQILDKKAEVKSESPKQESSPVQAKTEPRVEKSVKRPEAKVDVVTKKPAPLETSEPSEPTLAPAVKSNPAQRFQMTEKPAQQPQMFSLGDDKQGLMAESIEGMVASYPVSRIAKESLDEKDVKTLKDQDLWELPTMVMAQPTPQFAQLKMLTQGEENKVALPVARPIAQFMASLENELGVSQDRLIQAFQKLPPGQLQKEPSQTMSQVIKNLELDPKDEIRATELFSKMLSQLERTEDQKLSPLVPVAPVPVQAEAMEKSSEAPVAKAKAQVATQKYARSQVVSEKGPQTAEVSSHKVFAQKEENPQFSSKTMASKDDLKPVDSPFPAVAPKAAEVKAEGLTPVPESPQNVTMMQEQQPVVPTAAAIKANPQGDEKSTKDLAKGLKEVKKTSVTPTQTSAQASTVGQDFTPAKVEAPGAAVVGGAASQNVNRMDGEDSKHEAIRSIVNQAQMLAQKGGGEVKMSLKPDHLGEIQLKVAMEGNRVNVQMTAERSEVKKLIEQNVHELRHGLATHNLSMEKLDVSVGQKDVGNFNQGKSDFAQARDFANQFHQQQGSRREFLEDLGSIRSHAMKSMTVADRASDAQRFVNSKGAASRLNVVA